MKISEIQSSTKDELNAKVTVVVSEKAKRSLELVAQKKGLTISEVARKIFDSFLDNNSDELEKLDQGAIGA